MKYYIENKLKIPKKKIIVVDIKDNDNQNADIVDSNEVTTLDNIIEEKPIIEEAIIEDKPIEDKPVEDKIVRTNELVKCPKCMKLVTSKTLKYSHKKTCDGEDKPKPKPSTVIHDIEEVPKSPPKLVRTISRIAPVTPQPTLQMMREYRNQMRTQHLQMRSDKMNSLFTNSI